MTKVASALATYDVTTNREDVVDTVYNIDPADTPVTADMPKVKATAVLHEWSLDTLDAVSTTNAALEGDALTRATSTAPSRKSNYCQISQRDATVTGTQTATNPAGIADMFAYQVAKKSLVLRKDIEAIILSNQGQVAGNTTTARKLRSLNAWISSSGSRGTGGADSTGATYAATDGNTTNGTRDLTEALIKSALKTVYTAGGNPTKIFVGPNSKQLFSAFTGRSTSQVLVEQKQILGAASLYTSDFGDLQVIPNRTQRAQDTWIIDPTKLAIAFLRSFDIQDIGRTGDAQTKNIIAEYTVEVRAPAAMALVADCNV
jgi:hypothetical protein